MSSLKDVKLVVVGENNVGKTSLLIAYASGEFPTEYIPTVFDNYCCNVKYNDTTCSLALWDTAGDEMYDRLRPLSYPGTHVFLVMYSITDTKSFDQVQSKWVPEIARFCPGVPIILVANKQDVRADDGTVISTEQGKSLAQKIGAHCYIETSAKSSFNLKQLFEQRVFEAVAANKKSKKAADSDDDENKDDADFDADKMQSLQKAAKKDKSKATEFAQFIIDNKVPLERVSMDLGSLLEKLIDSNAPTHLIKAILENVDTVDADLLMMLAKSNELFPAVFANASFEAEEAAGICALATKENAQLIASKITQSDIDENLEKWVKSPPGLIVALHLANRIQLTQSQFDKNLLYLINDDLLITLDSLLQLPQFTVYDNALFLCLEKEEALRKLLAHSGNVNAKNNDQEPLVIAAIRESQVAAFKVILQTNKCDMNAKDADGHDAFYHMRDNDDFGKIYDTYMNEKRFNEQQAVIADLQSTIIDMQSKMQGMEQKVAQILALLQK